MNALIAEPFDIKRRTAREMAQTFDGLRRAYKAALTTAHGHAFLADRQRITFRTMRREHERFGTFRTLRQIDDIAFADIFARDLVFVVQRRAAHHDAADRNGLQFGDGGERAGAPDLDD